jgi:hypothetical protein
MLEAVADARAARLEVEAATSPATGLERRVALPLG